ncbi:hypothetical protein JXA05_00835 [Candidatus Peregrinibacteria bacterium]|nr:hypothetical protein [Candidatus Peregrinibacteria bacterium]
MAEKFEPVKVDIQTPDEVGEFRLDFEALGEEYSQAKFYLRDQEILIQAQLDGFKKEALEEYTGWLVDDNERAVNQALEDYAGKMNALLQEAADKVLAIAKKYPKGETADDLLAHYENVKKEFGPTLDRMIRENVNMGIATILAEAESKTEKRHEPALGDGMLANTVKATKTYRQRLDEISGL